MKLFSAGLKVRPMHQTKTKREKHLKDVPVRGGNSYAIVSTFQLQAKGIPVPVVRKSLGGGSPIGNMGDVGDGGFTLDNALVNSIEIAHLSGGNYSMKTSINGKRKYL